MAYAQFWYFIILAICYAVFTTSASLSYVSLKKKNIKITPALKLMRDVSLGQLIISSIFCFMNLLFAFICYRNPKGNLLHKKDFISQWMELALHGMMTMSGIYLGAYGSLENAEFSESKKKVVKDLHGKIDKSATTGIRVAMILNFILIFFHFFVTRFRANIYAYTNNTIFK